MTEPGLDAAAAAEVIVSAVEEGTTVVSVTLLDASARRVLYIGTEPTLTAMQSSGEPGLDQELEQHVHAVLHGTRKEGPVEIGNRQVYLEVHRPQPDLVIVGAGHIAQPLATLGDLLGFRVIVADDRPDFATEDRFPAASRVERMDFSDPFAGIPVGPLTHLVLVTRGHKYDYECLRHLLLSDVQPRYIGMIGSRRRVRATFRKLLDEGLSRDRLAEVRAPVGLDLGAETPAEIAVAVAAELILEWRGGTGAPLRQTEQVLERFLPAEEEEQP
jgi:xanthine dehydrogenase accessory factor